MLKRHRGNSDRSSDAPVFVGYVSRSVAASKRVLDIFGALAVLVVTAPLWPLIALAIKLDSRGPVFYRQTRVGRALADRTELFGILKFRSLSVGAEARTGVGLILRKTRLDELPQLLNVLKGDMSLIGPRPERPCFYSADRPVGLRPGITGLSQISPGLSQLRCRHRSRGGIRRGG
jgi:lipopolysaccharide/colanic/teichoic acid biosynthesis glycosyltransferase